ncbi:protein sll1483-like [Sycon ciliatum]|uniref:protein sll1483-like n=1 Tax=Sycon ciliatum TaxID=27933 RepID=UPI0031F70D71
MIRAVIFACLLAFASAQELDIPKLAVKLGATDLVEFVVKANLTSALSGPGPFTVFGPTNEAFSRLPPPIVELLTHNVTLLRDVLMYHVVSGRVYSSQLSNDLLAQSLLPEEKIRINIYKNTKTVVTAEGSPVVLTDQNATNGVIHVIDRVMLPPLGDIPTIVTRDHRFSTLLKAVSVAGLVPTLSGAGPFTVFAPTDEAFAKIPPKTLEGLLADKAKLTKVLTYHVISAAVWAAGLYDGEEAKTVEGSSLKFHIEEHEVAISFGTEGHSRVIEPNVAATNGVIHAIDTVLLPPDLF